MTRIMVCFTFLLLSRCCGPSFPAVNAEQAIASLEQAKQVFGPPSEARLLTHADIDRFNPSARIQLAQELRRDPPVISIWRRQCWLKGRETLVLVSDRKTGTTIAAASGRQIWN